MLINKKLGNLIDFDAGDRIIDRLRLEWFETNKRILNKKTEGGTELKLKFLNENPSLTQDDIIFINDELLIIIEINFCDVIILKPVSLKQMAMVCYEIGNKHLPLYYEDDLLLIPFDEPLYRWLMASGYEPAQEKRKLLHPLRTSVTAHKDSGNSLFSKILQLTNS